MGIPLLAGREFTRADVMGSPKVVIVNEAFAKTFFPAGDAISHHMRFGYSTDHPPDMEIVAIVKNSHHNGVKEDEIKPFVYVPYDQDANIGQLTYYIRTTQDPSQLSNSVRSVVNDLDASLPLTGLRTFEAQIDRLDSPAIASSLPSPKSSADWRPCSRRSAFTACWPTASRSASGRSAFAWPSAPTPATSAK